jgi:hypothetical protein
MTQSSPRCCQSCPVSAAGRWRSATMSSAWRSVPQAANLRSASRSTASAWVEALPANRTLVLSHSESSAALRRRLLISCLPPAARAITCLCGLAVSASDTEHPLTCDKAQGLRAQPRSHRRRCAQRVPQGRSVHQQRALHVHGGGPAGWRPRAAAAA